MQVRQVTLIRLLAALPLVAIAAACQPAGPPERGLSYDTLYLPFDLSPDRAGADLAAEQALGATRIYISCSEADLGDDRKLRVVLAAAHSLGLQVFADPYFGGLFSADEGNTAHLYLDQHPDDREISRRGQPADIPAYNSPGVRTYVKDRLRRLMAYDFDGLLLDEPWFPGPPGAEGDYYPYDPASQAAFAAQFGHAMPDAEDAEVEAFRQSSMSGFLRELTDLAKSLRPGIATALVVLPETDTTLPDYRGTRDWHALSEITTLDGLHVDPYWLLWGQSFDFFAQNVKRLETSVTRPGSTTGIWVQAYGLTAAQSSTVSQGLDYARAQGIASLNAWLTAHVPNEDDAAVRSQLAGAFAEE